jgi:adenosylmethionine-8-amino-7-oxononanoate aminotransferase
MKFNGLVPEIQPSNDEVELPLPYWKYGEIRDGRKVIDPILQYGCYVLGWHNQEIIDFVYETMKNHKPEIGERYMPKTNTIRLNHISFELSDRVRSITGMNSFYALSGSDANEGAIKLASAYQFEKGNHHKKFIVGFENSYHGSTFMTMSVGHDNFMDAPFYTLDRHQSVIRIPRNFENDVVDWNSVAAIMIESCAYGKGSEEPSAEFWARLDRIRKEHDVLIIIDDIFMGGGKSGTYTGWENMNIRPDISTMGKAITGGFFPLSMVLYNDKIKNSLPKNFNWQHGFTYCFSLPGIASAIKYLDILERDKFLANHSNVVNRAISIFNECGFEVYFRFGLIFRIRRENETHFYVLPVNADDEYFEALKENLEWFTQNTTR